LKPNPALWVGDKRLQFPISAFIKDYPKLRIPNSLLREVTTALEDNVKQSPSVSNSQAVAITRPTQSPSASGDDTAASMRSTLGR